MVRRESSKCYFISYNHHVFARIQCFLIEYSSSGLCDTRASKQIFTQCTTHIFEMAKFDKCFNLSKVLESILFSGDQGSVSISRCRLIGVGVPIIKKRRSHGRLIFKAGFFIPGETVFPLSRSPSLSHFRTQSADPKLYLLMCPFCAFDN